VTQVGPGRAAAPPHVFRVSEVMAGLRGLLADRVGRIWVAGEVSGLRRAASGHLYFTLKDESAQLRAVLFQGLARRLPFEPEDGLEFLVQGDVTVYEPRGDLQLLVQALEPRGQGALQLAFEQLRRRLEAAGLFEAARKRPLPAFPRTLGVVTSARGAALRDVIEVSARRFPAAPLLIAHARVQGEGAEAEIAAALAALDAREEVDAILLVRGGGSPEDLQPFNTELVARAIAACRTPVVSGVGHEIDVTIADLVADLRAPTPSAAAAAALPDRAAVELRLERDTRRLRAGVARALERARARLVAGGDALRAQAPWARVASRRLRLESAARALRREGAAAAERGRARLTALVGRLDTLSPLAVLGRGYAIARRVRDGAILRRASEVAAGDTVAVRLAEGEIEARVLAPAAATGGGPARG
jgi:exodeoxyribonuclease VII large subunit